MLDRLSKQLSSIHRWAKKTSFTIATSALEVEVSLDLGVEGIDEVTTITATVDGAVWVDGLAWQVEGELANYNGGGRVWQMGRRGLKISDDPSAGKSDTVPELEILKVLRKALSAEVPQRHNREALLEGKREDMKAKLEEAQAAVRSYTEQLKRVESQLKKLRS